jgi:predicted LPLAT superfamily acyltransferase
LNGEVIYLFHKRGEDKENYLRFKDYAKPNQKVLAKFHLKPEESQEIIEISRTKPEKLIETLKNYEEKYGRKKFFGIKI